MGKSKTKHQRLFKLTSLQSHQIIKKQYQNQVKHYINYESTKLRFIADQATLYALTNAYSKQIFKAIRYAELECGTLKICSHYIVTPNQFQSNLITSQRPKLSFSYNHIA